MSFRRFTFHETPPILRAAVPNTYPRRGHQHLTAQEHRPRRQIETETATGKHRTRPCEADDQLTITTVNEFYELPVDPSQISDTCREIETLMKPVWEEVARSQERAGRRETLNIEAQKRGDTTRRRIVRADSTQHVAPRPADIIITVERALGRESESVAAAVAATTSELEDLTIGELRVPRRCTRRHRYTRADFTGHHQTTHPNYHPG